MKLFIVVASLSKARRAFIGATLLVFDEMPPSTTPKPVSTVKKRHASEDSSHTDPRKRNAKRLKTQKSVPLDSSNRAADFNPAIAGLSSQLLADHVAQRTKRFAPELSAVELQDRYIPGIYCQTVQVCRISNC